MQETIDIACLWSMTFLQPCQSNEIHIQWNSEDYIIFIGPITSLRHNLIFTPCNTLNYNYDNNYYTFHIISYKITEMD